MITDEAMCSLALDIEQHGLETGQMVNDTSTHKPPTIWLFHIHLLTITS